MADDIKDQLKEMKLMLEQRREAPDSRDADYMALMNNVIKLRDHGSSDTVPAYIKVIITIIILFISIGGSWMGLEIKSAQIHEKVIQLEKYIINDKKDMDEQKELGYEIKYRLNSLEADVKRLNRIKGQSDD